MDDRVTPALWLDPSSRSPADYVALDAPGIERATLWTNEALGRTDLPRRVDDFPTLGVYEVEPASFADPGRGWLFHRTPRPGQGRLTGNPTVGLLVVLISPRAETDAQALRDWADFVHLNHIAAVATPGYTMVTPYERVGGGTPRFLHFYEMDTPDAEVAFKSMTPLVAERLGGYGSAEFDTWANHPSLRIDFVSTFRRVDA